jgi:TrmH family RNA methyltransferase
VQRVTSPANPRLRGALELVASSRERRKSGRCVLEGVHLVTVYQARVGVPELVVVADEALADDEVRAILAHVPPARVLAVPAKLLAEHTSLPPAAGILAVVPAPRQGASEEAAFTLLVEDVQDPGNVGSMLRTAAAAGVDQVLLSKACAFAWSPKVLRAGQGAHFLTRIAEDVDLPAWVARLRARGGRAIATVVTGGVALYDAPLARPLAIAIGNEGAGVSDALVSACGERVTIPMASGNESLNAAAAAAVVLFEAVRRERLLREQHR